MKLAQLLTGAAAAALLCANAHAYELIIGDVDADATEIPAGLVLASELIDTALSGELEVFIEQDNDGVFTTDDVRITLTLTNAVFTNAVTEANLLDDCATGGSVSSGGAQGTSEVTFLISGLDGCDGSSTDSVYDASGEIAFDFELTAINDGIVSLTTDIVTDSANTPVDGGTESVNLFTLQDAFSVIITPEGADEIADLDIDPIFTQFETSGVIGTIDLDCDTAVDVDFAGTAVDCTDGAQLEALDLVLTGDFTAYAPDGVSFNGDPLTIDADGLSATLDLASIGGLITAGGFGPQPIELIPNGTDPIIATDIEADVLLDLGPDFNDETFSGPLDSVLREGATVLFPWFAAQSIVDNGGAPNTARLANTSGLDARVFVEILASSNPAFVSAGPVQFGILPAGGELILGTQAVTNAIGADFGRGELEVSIEASAESITAKRFVRGADGTLTELESGSLAQDQN